MLDNHRISVIIPALNEAASLKLLLPAIPDYVDETIVVDNGSIDDTADVAGSNGAVVVSEAVRGYGRACLSGLLRLHELSLQPASASLLASTMPGDTKALHKTSIDHKHIVVFLDADYCDDPINIRSLCLPIIKNHKDFVLSNRMHSQASGYLTIPQRFGNQFACLLINMIWKARYQDLGPFRAISATALKQLSMVDQDFGWTVEMQIKAAQHELRTLEIDLPYRARQLGVSKVSGTLSGVWHAGTKIIYVIARSYLRRKK